MTRTFRARPLRWDPLFLTGVTAALAPAFCDGVHIAYQESESRDTPPPSHASSSKGEAASQMAQLLQLQQTQGASTGRFPDPQGRSSSQCLPAPSVLFCPVLLATTLCGAASEFLLAKRRSMCSTVPWPGHVHHACRACHCGCSSIDSLHLRMRLSAIRLGRPGFVGVSF